MLIWSRPKNGTNEKEEFCGTSKIIPVIQISSKRGTGNEGDPIREVLEYWDIDGKLLFTLNAVRKVETMLLPEASDLPVQKSVPHQYKLRRHR